MISDTTQRDRIERHAETEFGFLVEQSGAGRTRESDGDRTVLAYLLPDVFVEVELDWVEAAAFALVGTPADGARPGGYYVDGTGRKVRWHLVQAVERRSDGAELAARLRRVTRESGPEAMTSQVDALAAAVRQALPELPELVRQLT
ncbi:hypothetical protein K7640_00800 [Micromonospora sp. PLK6-60]|uniref:hypothetical protein n=1 Tax=Micromonospora sp. PLK6-60 TaxID=2873383 RepID=UPI001CA7502A|nr:hypothetical protein [Micromonospora sp. PLK6-60]MBY8870380.1 hypothetical protein [Micromonospora sp. PLK6-60]